MKRFLPALAASLIIAVAATQPAAAQNNSNHMSIRVAGWEVQLGEPRDSHFHIENVPDDSVIYPATTKAQTIQGSKTVSRDPRCVRAGFTAVREYSRSDSTIFALSKAHTPATLPPRAGLWIST